MFRGQFRDGKSEEKGLFSMLISEGLLEVLELLLGLVQLLLHLGGGAGSLHVGRY